MSRNLKRRIQDKAEQLTLKQRLLCTGRVDYPKSTPGPLISAVLRKLQAGSSQDICGQPTVVADCYNGSR